MPDRIRFENPRASRCALRRAKLSLFAFVTILFFGAAVNAAGQSPTSIWSSASTPGLVDAGIPEPAELGVKFTSSQAGFITGIRFYKSAANTGTHIGNLWTSSGIQLASAVFTNESASGWQQVTFSSPVAISANTTYVASYFAPYGHFSLDLGFFATAGVDNPPLQALADAVSPNGVYTYGPQSAFPASTWNQSNFWVDVVYSSTIPAAASVWSSTATPATVDSGDAQAVELGLNFISSQAGSITGIRFYKSAANTGTHIGNLWTTSGTLLASAVFTNETAAGWQQASFSSPVAISANTIYVASYYAPLGHYSGDQGFFTTAGVDNPPLHALANTLSPNGVFAYGPQSVFPVSTAYASNYWVDVAFAAGTGTGTAGGASLSPTSLTFASQGVGVTSTAQTIFLNNTGSANMTITSIALTGANSGDFAQTNLCGNWLGAGTGCTISVTFSPTASGTRTAALTFTDDATDSPQTVSLTGTGTGAGVVTTPAITSATTTAVASLSSSSLEFGNAPVAVASSSQVLTLNNTGSMALSITSIAFTGANATDFNQVNTCGASLAAGGSCTIAIVFTPSAIGTRTASVTIADDASGSPQAASLSGTGTHDVILSWTDSPNPGIIGYNVYRGTTSGGQSPTPLNSTPINGTTYTDGVVTAGATYYYVVTTVASNNGTESAASNEASATVPSP